MAFVLRYMEGMTIDEVAARGGPSHVAEPDLGRDVAAEVAHAQARHHHGGLRRSGGWA